MDFMRALDQIVRDIKREVNLKVLKVPEIEQKVLDATNDEPWGPNVTALSEIAKATKKLSDCPLVMYVLWTRLTDTGPNWRHVYKALTVIEFLVANGSESALDDILAHISWISAISEFEYVEPKGKDVGINVRIKVETILALLNDREKIQAIRDKRVAPHDKYYRRSSTTNAYASRSASYGGSNSDDRFGNQRFTRRSNSMSFDMDKEFETESKCEDAIEDVHKPKVVGCENEMSKSEKLVPDETRNRDSVPSKPPRILNKPTSNSSRNNVQPQCRQDDFDDFDPRLDDFDPRLDDFNPRGSSASGSGDLKNAEPADPSLLKTTPTNESTASPQLDPFTGAIFPSDIHAEATSKYHNQGDIDLFASRPAFPTGFPSNVDLFGVPDTNLESEEKSSVTITDESFDPFVAFPVNILPSETSQSSTRNSHHSLEEDFSFHSVMSYIEETNAESARHSSENILDNPEAPSTASTTSADFLTHGIMDLN
ncbi:clathrin interactor EPSIN 1-like [Zingiber officinale]|uniref:clathrin interactor EPSIN 1-like n=1 Tax=Zingiber officinale TaxID=94328 RepID=UPI001C4B7A0C|nr:clathrin interactor EPSIN 1-like [Zingiber officinale]